MSLIIRRVSTLETPLARLAIATIPGVCRTPGNRQPLRAIKPGGTVGRAASDTAD